MSTQTCVPKYNTGIKLPVKEAIVKKLINVGVVSVSLGLGVWAWAHDDMAMPQKAGSPEFQQMKGLAGTWKGKKTPLHPGEKADRVVVKIKVTAAGSAIEETLGPGTPHEMVDMYSDQNGKLSMVHYCAIGNQPHMVLKQAGPHQIQLEMGPSAGIDAAKDMHMHALTLDFPDANHLTETWTSYQGGKPGDTAVFTLTRAP